MRRLASVAIVVAAAVAAAAISCAPRPAVDFTEAERATLLSMSPKPPLPPDPTNRWADDACAARLGRELCFDPRLSADGSVSCASCHVPELSLTDGRALGQGMGTTARHVPTLWNTAFNRWWFWDGRADTAWSQVLGPMESRNEHGGTRVGVARIVAGDPALRAAYERLFGPLPPLEDRARFPEQARPDPWERWSPHAIAWKGMAQEDRDAIDAVAARVAKSLGAFERTLVGGEAPFDRFVAALRGKGGDLGALSPAAQRGARVFIGKGRCTTCHHGPLLSDLEFHDLHLESAVLEPRDTGRFRGIELLRRDPFNSAGAYADDGGATASKLEYLAQQPENWGQFKTPSLRNVARTPPYMHDGRFATLQDVVHYYRTLEGAVPPASHAEKTLQAVDLTDGEAEDLVAFLESLDEELPPVIRPGPLDGTCP